MILDQIKAHIEEELKQTNVARAATKAAKACRRCAEALIACLSEEEKALHGKWKEAFDKKNVPAADDRD